MYALHLTQVDPRDPGQEQLDTVNECVLSKLQGHRNVTQLHLTQKANL